MGLISRRLSGRGRNLEITSSEELAAFLRGVRETWSGTDVTVAEAEKVAAWTGGLRVVAEDIGKLPFVLYHEGEARQRATDSQWWTVVHDRASLGWSSQGFREYMTYWAGHDGDSYALKVESRTQGLELVPFKRGVVRPERLDDGAMVYHVADFQEPLGMRRVFHLRGFVTGWERGANTFQMSREEIGLSLAMERHAATFFKNGAVMGGVVKHPGEMSDKAYAHLKESLREEHTGENAHNWLILEENADWLPSSAEPQKSQLVEGREFQVRDHARRLRVPPHKLGDLKDATFSNIEHQAIEYVQDSLLPWALRWETAYRMQVLPVAAQVYAELLFDMLLRGDSETRSKVYTAAILNGWMTQNEARRRENLPPLAGGDELFTPLNSATTAEREAKRTYDQARSARQLVDAGYDPAAVLTTVGLPEMEWVGKPESASESEGQGSERDEPNVATI